VGTWFTRIEEKVYGNEKSSLGGNRGKRGGVFFICEIEKTVRFGPTKGPPE